MSGLQQVQMAVGELLAEIADQFKAGAKVTLIVRSPQVPGNTDFVMTDDSLDDAIAVLQRRKAAA